MNWILKEDFEITANTLQNSLGLVFKLLFPEIGPTKTVICFITRPLNGEAQLCVYI